MGEIGGSGPAAWAIIPARGGSKGVPGKNLRRLGGRSLIGRCVRAAAEARRVRRVVVTTDDDKIAAEAERHGAEIVLRPAALADDTASSEAAIIHALETMAARCGDLPEVTAFLQCTSPFTQPGDVDGCIETVLSGADSALGVTRSHGFLWRQDGSGATGINHDLRSRPRRQDREPEFLETGAVYAFRTQDFLAARHRFFGQVGLYEMAPERIIEIDSEADFVRAEALLAVEAGARARTALPDPLRAVVMDFDGVFTDNRVLVMQDGTEGVLCNRGDGMGLAALKAIPGLALLILSTERNPVVSARAEKLGLEVMQGIADKAAALTEWAEGRGISLSQTVYIGNDVNDLGCLQAVGCGVVVADAHGDAMAVADLVLDRPGGDGALRALCDLILGHGLGGRA